jgi:hypothetical protein
MKTLRCVLTALVLSCWLSTAAIAGEIQGAGLTAPPPPPPPATNALGDIQGAGMLLLELLRLATIF